MNSAGVQVGAPAAGPSLHSGSSQKLRRFLAVSDFYADKIRGGGGGVALDLYTVTKLEDLFEKWSSIGLH